MAIARSKITAQGQIPVPAAVRRKLDVGPGSVLEWHENGEEVVICRAGCYTSEDIHRALFRKPPRARTVKEMKAGTRRHLKARDTSD
jgi:AbrB family looped-hinge helix DNA binding protein